MASITVTGFPATVTAGTAGSVTVTAKDGNGNVATAYTGAVRFTSSDAQAVLPANYTFVAADNGTHTFTITFKMAGMQSITATDTVTGTITGSQSGITVDAGAFTKLQLLVPGETAVPGSATGKSGAEVSNDAP